MENKLKSIFEYQKFEQNKTLSEFIDSTKEKYGIADNNAGISKFRPLSDEDLMEVSAAGMKNVRSKLIIK